MAVNDLTFNQSASILNSIVAQAKGAPMSINNLAEFVTVGQVALKVGYDPLSTAISQVLSGTIFADRAYTGKLRGIRADSRRFGNIIRKLNLVDSDFEPDQRFELVDGEPIDQWIVKKPSVLQLNFYGANVYARHVSVLKDQYDCAFTGPDELIRFLAYIMSNIRDQITQANENCARATIANFIGGKIAGDPTNVIHLVSVYNDKYGTDLDSDTVRQPANWKPFAEFVAGYLKTLTGFMSERTTKYHVNVEGKPVPRHTPANRLKCYMLAEYQNSIMTSVMANTFNSEYLKTIDYELINFWQAIDSPDGINVNPIYLKTDGTLTSPEAPVVQGNIFGVLFDEEALGYTVVNQWMMPTGMNAAGGYTNYWYHWTERYWNDFTENGIVLLLD